MYLVSKVSFCAFFSFPPSVDSSPGQSTAVLPPPTAFVLACLWASRQRSRGRGARDLLHPRGFLQKCSGAPPEPPRGLTYIPENAPRRPMFEGGATPGVSIISFSKPPRCTSSFPR
ncbi:hypothetical protein MTO96_049512 [Rhipicephalus appendiculatus]